MLKLLVSAAVLANTVEAKQNPIRRVVQLLQEMSKEITDQVAKEKESYKKFQCYCSKNNKGLDAKTEEAQATISLKEAEVEGFAARGKQLAEELKQAKKDRVEAQKNLKAATEKRATDKAKFDEATADLKQTLANLDKAIGAIEKGMGKAFLQTGAAKYLQGVADSTAVQGLDINQQQMLASFLQSGADYSSSSGEIVGILKQIKDEMDRESGGIISAEKAAGNAFKKIKASLTSLIATNTSAIESKTEEKGEVAVNKVNAQNAVATTKKQLGDDLATAAELKTACEDKAVEFDERQKDAAAEVDAINQAIGVLNNDDALDLFKKTDTSAIQMSLLQISKVRSPIKMALDEVEKVNNNKNAAIALLAFSTKQALSSGKVDFSKIMKMIDDMVVILKQEGKDDEVARENCITDLDIAEDESKEIAHKMKGLNAQIESAKAAIVEQNGVIERSKQQITDAQVAQKEATEQRNKENAEFVEAVDLNTQAVELIMKAKDKLNTYYNPDQVRDVPAEEAAKEEGFLQLPEQPDTWDAGSRKNKGQAGGNVLALMDKLANDLRTDTASMEHAEQTAQRDYEKLTNDLAVQQAESKKSLNDAVSTKADAESSEQTYQTQYDAQEQDKVDNEKTTADLHAQCDFILETFEERRAARDTEVEGLTKAKSVLSGAKFD